MTQVHDTNQDNGRSVISILTDLWEKTETLVRQEMKLASAELDQKLATAKRDLIALGIAGAALFAGFSSIVAAVILLLSEAMEPWLAAGLVGLVSAVVGYVLLQRERRAAAELVPDKTIESVKKDVHTIREATHDSIQESRT
jgi:uncharacterized membrane protein YqjE